MGIVKQPGPAEFENTLPGGCFRLGVPVTYSHVARQSKRGGFVQKPNHLYIHISTMDDQHTKDVQADAAAEKAREAEKAAAAAHGAAALAHEEKVTEETEKSAP